MNCFFKQGLVSIAIALLFSGTAHAETIELITYYPAQVNLGEANLNTATVGTTVGAPAPGELFVESRVRIGDPGDVGDRSDSSLSIFSPTTNNSNGFINIYVTEPYPTSGPNSEMRILTGAKRNTADNTRLDWTWTIGPGDTPYIRLFNAHRPDGGTPSFETPFTAAWDGFIGINNTNPEAMLHIGSPLPGGRKGDILLENPRAIKWRDRNGNIQNVLTYTTANNTILQQAAPTGSVVLSVLNDSQIGSIQMRTGTGQVDLTQGIDETLRMYISNDGRVGIGGPYNNNDEPEYDLTIEPYERNNAAIKVKGGGDTGTAGYAGLILQAGGVSNSNQAWVWQRYNDPLLRIWTQGENRVLIEGSGTRTGGLGSTSNAITHMKIGRGTSTDIVKNSPAPASVLYNSGTLDVGDIYLRSTNSWMSESGVDALWHNLLSGNYNLGSSRARVVHFTGQLSWNFPGDFVAYVSIKNHGTEVGRIYIEDDADGHMFGPGILPYKRTFQSFFRISPVSGTLDLNHEFIIVGRDTRITSFVIERLELTIP